MGDKNYLKLGLLTTKTTIQSLISLKASDDLVDAIGEISPTAAAGPDRFPAMLLKQCKSTLAVPLHIIWRKSLDTGQIPQILKSAHVIPIYKGECRGTPKNYRPIALTSHLIKVFEKVIRKKMVKYMETYNLFNGDSEPVPWQVMFQRLRLI